MKLFLLQPVAAEVQVTVEAVAPYEFCFLESILSTDARTVTDVRNVVQHPFCSRLYNTNLLY